MDLGYGVLWAWAKWFNERVEFIRCVSRMTSLLDVYIWVRRVREAFVSNEMKYVKICDFYLEMYSFGQMQDIQRLIRETENLRGW